MPRTVTLPSLPPSSVHTTHDEVFLNEDFDFDPDDALNQRETVSLDDLTEDVADRRLDMRTRE